MSSSIDSSGSGADRICTSSSSRPSISCFSPNRRSRRRWSIARRLATVISHAPGFSGRPECGQRSSARTSASCARSSATPDIAHHAGEPGDDPGRFDSPDGGDLLMKVGACHGGR